MTTPTPLPEAEIAKTPDDVIAAAVAACKAHNVQPMGLPFHPSLEARVAITAILAERQRSQWQPIETAPKDGTPILAADSGPFPFVVEWFAGGRAWIAADGRYWSPIYWQPLPTVPVEG